VQTSVRKSCQVKQNTKHILIVYGHCGRFLGGCPPILVHPRWEQIDMLGNDWGIHNAVVFSNCNVVKCLGIVKGNACNVGGVECF
jgi:hypothetical protein